jgi:hypothetical protein
MAIEAGTKFLGIASSVDTKERRSKRINDKSEYHTIEDIAAAATAGIVFPDPVDADTIVVQLDAENYTTIESNLSGKLPYMNAVVSYAHPPQSSASWDATLLYNNFADYENSYVQEDFDLAWDAATSSFISATTTFSPSLVVDARVSKYAYGLTNAYIFEAGVTQGGEIKIKVIDATNNTVVDPTTPTEILANILVDFRLFA